MFLFGIQFFIEQKSWTVAFFFVVCVSMCRNSDVRTHKMLFFLFAVSLSLPVFRTLFLSRLAYSKWHSHLYLCDARSIDFSSRIYSIFLDFFHSLFGLFFYNFFFFSFVISRSLSIFFFSFNDYLIHWLLLMNRKYDEDVRSFVLFICIPQVRVKFQMPITPLQHTNTNEKTGIHWVEKSGSDACKKHSKSPSMLADWRSFTFALAHLLNAQSSCLSPSLSLSPPNRRTSFISNDSHLFIELNFISILEERTTEWNTWY